MIQPLSELRTTLKFYPHQQNSFLRFFAKDASIDFDVHLKSKGYNLQRDFVWNLDQKREIIWSILKRRHIPRMSFVLTYDDVYKIVDGKQRLSSMLDFYNNKFTLLAGGIEYYFKDLPEDHQKQIGGYALSYNVYNEYPSNPLTDQQLIDWFTFINFAGTPQDKEHLEKLNKQG